METVPQSFYTPQDLFCDVEERLARARAQSEPVDYLAFVPDGEPTLDKNLGAMIAHLEALGVPVGVITNGSLLWREDVRNELSRARWVSLKVDATREVSWRRINRPCRALELPQILDGVLAFARAYHGELMTETMLVAGINDRPEDLMATAEFLRLVRPHTAYLSVPTRPPALRGVVPPDERVLNQAYHLFRKRVNRVEYLLGYEGNSFASTSDVADDILSITAVHPMREDAVMALLSRTGNSGVIVDHLVTAGALTVTEYEHHRFYLRAFPRKGREMPGPGGRADTPSTAGSKRPKSKNQ